MLQIDLSAHSPESSDLEHRPFREVVRSWIQGEWIDIPHLKLIGLVLPMIFAVSLELVLFPFADAGNKRQGYLLTLVAVSILTITTFGLVMFRLIERAQQQVRLRNRELAACNAVSNAIQGEVGLDRIISVVLETVLVWSRAIEVSITIFSPDAPPQVTNSRIQESPRSHQVVPVMSPEQRDDVDLIEIPIYAGAKVLGRMRLFMPLGRQKNDGIGVETLTSIGHQVADAIQLAELVADLERKNRKGSAFHDVLLQISNQNSLSLILASILSHARNLVGADEAVICLNDEAFKSLRFDENASTMEPNIHNSHESCSIRSDKTWSAVMTIPLGVSSKAPGELWVARNSEKSFSVRDREYLETLAGFATIALNSVEIRENEHQGAILTERERIAREMHDSLAQVLGATHLRLRALDSREEIRNAPHLSGEIAEIADICEDAYRDVREAILGLRESSKNDRGLLGNLRTYLNKFSQQCGMETSLCCELDHELALSPRSEVQIIRVVQEAMTNARKHSGGQRVIVRITESPSGTTFIIEDDGHGFNHDGSHADGMGFGLFIMHERLKLIKGSLTIDSFVGRGTRIIATVPEHSGVGLSFEEANNVD